MYAKDELVFVYYRICLMTCQIFLEVSSSSDWGWPLYLFPPWRKVCVAGVYVDVLAFAKEENVIRLRLSAHLLPR